MKPRNRRADLIAALAERRAEARRKARIAKRITFVAAPGRPAFTSSFVDGYGWFVWQAGYRGAVELVAT